MTLPPGKLVYAAPLVAFKGNDIKHLRGALAPRPRVHAAHLEAIGDVLGNGHVRK